jgi:hypothetical protein
MGLLKYVKTIDECKTKCDEHNNCLAFNYDDEEKQCNLEQYRRPTYAINTNTRFCAKPGIFFYFWSHLFLLGSF